MNMFLRGVLLLKVFVMLSLGSSAAWAECDEHQKHASMGQVAQGEMMLATSEEEQGDEDNDDSSIDQQDPDEGDDTGDSKS